MRGDRIVKLWRGIGNADQVWTLLGYIGLQGWIAAAASSLAIWLIGMLTHVPWAVSLTCASVIFAATIAASFYWEKRKELNNGKAKLGEGIPISISMVKVSHFAKKFVFFLDDLEY